MLAEPATTFKAMLGRVSTALGHTPAISRKHYIQPMLIAAARGEAEGRDIAAVTLP